MSWLARTGRRRFGFVLLLVFAAAIHSAVASDWAAIEGVILDENRAPLPGVTVVARSDNLATGERGTTTDSAGRYRIQLLPPGRGYRLRATLPGYAPIEFTDLTLVTGKTFVQDMQLRPASEMQERVRVSGRSDTVDTESVTTSTTFSANFIGELPVFGRDYQEILTLAPGVTDVDKTGNPNIHGARGTDVITLVDGVSTTDPFTGYFGQQLNIESIQEVEVITAGAPADYSRAQGGFANIITKSGGNEFQGTFKLFIRSNRVDGDGAGVDPPDIGGFAGATASREMSFTDLKPYLSLSGAFVRDRLWYYLASEYIQEETPVNAITQSYVTRTTGLREFGKLTWQATPAQKMALSVIFDRTQNEDQGLGSFTDVESGYSFRRGGPTYTLKHSVVPKPSLVFETSASWFDNRFQVIPTLEADTNGNGTLFIDYDGDGISKANERDPGEDYDFDGAYDIFEDLGGNNGLEADEDLDSDGHRTTQFGCEGHEHEDLNCNGHVDHEVDINQNGYVEPAEDTGLLLPCPQSLFGYCLGAGRPTQPGTANNGRFDTEDANGNALLDVVGGSGQTPFPFWNDANGNGIPDAGEYRRPQAPDRDYLQDSYGRTSGPYPYSHDDHRSRLTLREDSSTFVGDLFGTHDLRMGAVYEKESYTGYTEIRPTLFGQGLQTRVSTNRTRSQIPSGFLGFFAIPVSASPTADGDNFGVYFQDTYKPVPNLAIGLGLRLDVERLTSSGYTPFDPAEERRAYDQLMEATGTDTNPYDMLGTTGLCGDPLAECQGSPTNLVISQVYSQLRAVAPKRLARHQLGQALISPFLERLLGRVPTAADFLASGINPRQPETVELENRNLAPRLSVSWDPWGDGKTKGFLSWGRYYDKLFLQSIALEQGPDQLSRYYSFDFDGVNSQTGHPDHQIGGVISTSPFSVTSVDRDLSTPYSDELTLGFEREIAPEVSVRLTYIRRDYRDQLQDVDINHYQTLDPSTGRERDVLGQVVCGSGGDVAVRNQCLVVADGLPDLYVQNFFFNRIFHLGNSNAQEYRGWELELVRRLSRKWQLEGSYTYSEATGDAESYLSESGDDPSLVEYEHGYLSYDQRHVVKLNAVAYLPGDWRLGGSAQWSSGLPYSEVFNGRALDDAGYAQARVVYGHIDQNGTGGMVREGRNIHRNPAAYLFNVRVQKNFVLGKSSASGFLEVYNLLNSDDLRIYQVEWLVTGDIVNRVERSIGTRDFGRRFQFGFQVYF